MSREPTTPDLIELTRAYLEAANRRDLDAMMSFYAPDSTWESPPLGTSFQGAAAIRGFHEHWIGAYEELEFELDEILDIGHGVVFAVVCQNARPVGSTGRVQTRMAVISELVDGKIVRVTVYYDIDEARAAAERLAEERARADV
jgi:ketosteroid isomerase-like protein